MSAPLAALFTYLNRHTGRGRHAPRVVARRRHPAGSRLERPAPAGGDR